MEEQGSQLDVRQPCEACHNTGQLKLFEKNGIGIVQCRSCGLVFTDLSATDYDRLPEIYSEAYFTGEQSKLAWGNFGYANDYFKDRQEEKLKIARRDLKAINKLVDHRGRLLDVGCAAGFFLKEAKQEDWQTYGIEISKFAARYAKEQFKLNVETGTLESASFPLDYFDVITAWDLIEHLPSPSRFLMKVSQLLKPEGLLVLGTPNVDSLAARIKGRKWRHYNPPEHLFYFGAATLQKIIQPYLRVVRVQAFKAPYSKIQPSLKFIIKRMLFIQFNNISSGLKMGEYLKAYAWK